MVIEQDGPMLELRGVSKRFGAVVALRDGQLTLYPGSIHALVGENGAGKSTLVKIMAGLYARDTGEFRLEGKPAEFRSTAESKDAGIAVIYQEPTLFPDLSVTENIFMGRQPLGRFGTINRSAMRAEVLELMSRLGVSIDPDRPTGPLHRRPADHRDRQGHLAGRKVLIMDEPTSTLRGGGRPAFRGRSQPAETRVGPSCSSPPVRRGVLAVRHHHRDARRQLHRHRQDGPDVGSRDRRMMVGRDVVNSSPRWRPPIGDVVLEVRGLTFPDASPISASMFAPARSLPGWCSQCGPLRGGPRCLRRRSLQPVRSCSRARRYRRSDPQQP